jgi:hypothetical protein
VTDQEIDEKVERLLEALNGDDARASNRAFGPLLAGLLKDVSRVARALEIIAGTES